MSANRKNSKASLNAEVYRMNTKLSNIRISNLKSKTLYYDYNALKIYKRFGYAALVLLFLVLSGVITSVAEEKSSTGEAKLENTTSRNPTIYKTVKVDGLDIFYREAGPKGAPTILLLHGFPTSSQMFSCLIAELSDKFHLLAPDYPGFGNSDQPSMKDFDYTFDNLAKISEGFINKLGIKKFSLYLMDYGAPVGFRIAAKYPKRVEALIIQNGNAYDEGLLEFWDPIKKYWKDRTPENAKPLAEFITFEGVKWQYTHGVRNTDAINPDNWNLDLRHLTREGNPEIQLALFYDYQSNVPLYPKWQEYFRKYQPPTLIVWGKNDYIFPADGAHPYKRDLKNVDFNLLNTGHFALEEDCEVISDHISSFMDKNLSSTQ